MAPAALGSSGDAVGMFCTRWGLDTMAEGVLRKLDPQLQQRVMSQFAPKDVSRGASIPFMGFVKSVANSAPLVQAPMVQQVLGGVAHSADGSDGLSAFVNQW